jgi:hypothetical protein
MITNEENEEEDPEELVPIDDSDDEGSGVSEVVEGLC